MRKRAPLLIAAVLVTCLAGAVVESVNWAEISAHFAEFESYETREGAVEAEADIAAGTPKWKVYGRGSREDERSEQMKQLFALRQDHFCGCLVSDAIQRYAYRYNSRIRAHFVSLYGEDMVHEVMGAPPRDPSQQTEEG
ncbi:MAG: hypothetical protein V4773_18770 [Verrucomicrobiota bacterium]